MLLEFSNHICVALKDCIDLAFLPALGMKDRSTLLDNQPFRWWKQPMRWHTYVMCKNRSRICYSMQYYYIYPIDMCSRQFTYLSIHSSFMRTKRSTDKFGTILQVESCKRRWRLGIITTLSAHQSAQRRLCRRSRSPAKKRSASAAAASDRTEHRRHGRLKI